MQLFWPSIIEDILGQEELTGFSYYSITLYELNLAQQYISKSEFFNNKVLSATIFENYIKFIQIHQREHKIQLKGAEG